MTRLEIPISTVRRSLVARALWIACSVWLIGMGAWFALLRPAFLPEDLRFVGDGAAALSADPHVAAWLHAVFRVLGGFQVACGVLALGLARADALEGLERAAALAAGAAGPGLMAWVNFSIHSDFRWILLVPVIAWSLALALDARLRWVKRLP